MISIPTRLTSKRKRVGFKLLAILLGFLPFLLLELGFVIAGVGKSDLFDDTFVEFSEVHPLFVIDEQKEVMVVAPSRREFFAHDQFPIKKQPDTFRIFCLGGSTVQGRPYSIETSFSTWLKLGLEIAEPQRNWEVINCGGVSYASYRLLPIMQECLEYEPDLLILCTGHNEFLEDRSYENIKESPAWLRQSVNQLSRLRTVSTLSSLIQQEQSKPVLAADADAILNYENGLAAYHRDEAWNDSIAEHFESNIRRMVHICREAEVPILLMLPPSNLSGTPPLKSESQSMTLQEKQSEQKMKDEARSLYQTDLERATQLWEEICRINGMSAKNHFEFGQCLDFSSRPEEAREEYLMARDLDVCPLRMTSSLERILLKTAKETQTPLINLHELLELKTSNQLLGDRWLVDHVHPNFEGHQQIAFTIGRWLEEERLLALSQDWETECQPIFNQHFESLERSYFHKGQRALQGLKLWTQGNADGPPVEERFPHLLNN